MNIEKLLVELMTKVYYAADRGDSLGVILESGSPSCELRDAIVQAVESAVPRIAYVHTQSPPDTPWCISKKSDPTNFNMSEAGAKALGGIGPQPCVLDKPVSFLELSVRARKCLKKMKIMAVRNLVGWSGEELLANKGFGETTLKEVNEELARHGLTLGMSGEGLNS